MFSPTNRNSQRGTSLVEYTLIVVTMAVLGIGAISQLGTNIVDSFSEPSIVVAGGGSETTADSGGDPTPTHDAPEQGVPDEQCSAGACGGAGNDNGFAYTPET